MINLKQNYRSQNGNGGYDVCSTDLGWVCSCPDHKFRGVKCKHIFAVEISFALRKEVEVARIALLTTTTCIYCDSSNIVKDGLRHNKYGDIQKYDWTGSSRLPHADWARARLYGSGSGSNRRWPICSRSDSTLFLTLISLCPTTAYSLQKTTHPTKRSTELK